MLPSPSPNISNLKSKFGFLKPVPKTWDEFGKEAKALHLFDHPEPLLDTKRYLKKSIFL